MALILDAKVLDVRINKEISRHHYFHEKLLSVTEDDVEIRIENSMNSNHSTSNIQDDNNHDNKHHDCGLKNQNNKFSIDGIEEKLEPYVLSENLLNTWQFPLPRESGSKRPSEIDHTEEKGEDDPLLKKMKRETPKLISSKLLSDALKVIKKVFYTLHFLFIIKKYIHIFV